MYRKKIIRDFGTGIRSSLRVDLVAALVMYDDKFLRLMIKFLKYNFMLHVVPYLILSVVANILHHDYLSFLVYPLVNRASDAFHLLHFMDLINIVSNKYATAPNTKSSAENLAMSITMVIYQFAIYCTISIIDILFRDKIYIFAIILKFLILSIYHSFYCYNNLWQHKKMDILNRIGMHEKYWPYFMGYGTLASTLYLYIANPFMFGIYNLYMVCILAIPICMGNLPFKTDFYAGSKSADMGEPSPLGAKRGPAYPAISLTIFSYVVNWIAIITKLIINQLGKLWNFVSLMLANPIRPQCRTH